MKNLETTTTSSQNVVVPTTAPEVTQTVPMITPVDAMNTPKKILFGLWSFLKLVLLGILIFFGIFYGVGFLRSGNWIFGGFNILITIFITLIFVLPRKTSQGKSSSNESSFSLRIIGIPVLQTFFSIFGFFFAYGLAGGMSDQASRFAYLSGRVLGGAFVIDILSGFFVLFILANKSGPRYRNIKRAACIVPFLLLVFLFLRG